MELLIPIMAELEAAEQEARDNRASLIAGLMMRDRQHRPRPLAQIDGPLFTQQLELGSQEEAAHETL